jgi:hypothetical protein
MAGQSVRCLICGFVGAYNGWNRRKPIQASSKSKAEQKMNSIIGGIARRRGIQTLEARHSDSLDFFEVSVWGLKDMLQEAYKAGYSSGYQTGKREG